MRLVIDSNNDEKIDVQLDGFNFLEVCMTLDSILTQLAEAEGEDAGEMKMRFLSVLTKFMAANKKWDVENLECGKK